MLEQARDFGGGGEGASMLGEREPGGDFGSPFGCKVRRGVLIFVASQGR